MKISKLWISGLTTMAVCGSMGLSHAQTEPDAPAERPALGGSDSAPRYPSISNTDSDRRYREDRERAERDREDRTRIDRERDRSARERADREQAERNTRDRVLRNPTPR